MLPLSELQKKLPLEDALGLAVDKNKKLNEQFLKDKSGEVKYAEIIAERKDAAGSWDYVASPSIKQFSKDAATEYGSDKKSLSNSIANYRSMLTSMFSGDALSANYIPYETPPFISIDRLTGSMGVAPPSLFEQSRNYGTFKTSEGEFDCKRNIFQATAAAVGQVAVSAVSNQLKALQGLAMSMEFLMKSVENIKSAVMNLAVQDLLALLISQKLILQQIISVVKQINEIAMKLEDTDYSVIHLILVRREQVRLQDAIDKLDDLKTKLIFGADFDYDLWDSAKADIKTTEDDFCGGVEAGVSLRLIQMVGLRMYLAVLFRILARQQAIRDSLEEALLGFSKEFELATQFENLYIPIVEAIKCRLEAILADMESTAEKNQILSFLIKEKIWCVELKAIRAFMNFSTKAKLPTALDKISDNATLQTAADAVMGFLNDQISGLQRGSGQEVLEYGVLYLAAVDRKLKSDIDPRFVTQVGADVINAAETAMANSTALGGVLGGFSGAVGAVALGAVAAVEGLMSFAADQSLTSFVDAIKAGKLSEAFGIDAFTKSIEGQVSNLTAQISKLASEKNVSRAVKDELDAAAKTFQDEARNLSLMSELEHGYADKHLKDSVDVEYRKRKQQEAAYKKAAETLAPGLKLPDLTDIL